MISIVSLLVAAALVSHQCGFEASAEVNHKHLDNSLKPNVISTPKQAGFGKFVRIVSSAGEAVRRSAGERGVLECKAMGNPGPTVYWMKNGQIVSDFTEESNEIIPSNGLAELTTKILITSTAPGEDEYSCVVEAGTNRDVATTIVYTIPTQSSDSELFALEGLFHPSSPVINYKYNTLFANSGSTVLLPCRVQSQGSAQVQWLDKNGDVVNDGYRMRVLPDGDLLISNLQFEEHMGQFTCIAENAYGRDVAPVFVYPVKN